MNSPAASDATPSDATQATTSVSTRVVVLVGLIVALVLASVVALFASTSPDGLERVAEDVGFADTATDSAVASSPLADYQVGGSDADEASWRSALAGVAGVAIMSLVAFAGFAAMARRPDQSRPDQS